MELEFPQQILEKYSNIKFHESTSSGSRVSMRMDRRIQTDGQIGRQTDMTKLIVAVRHFVNARNKVWMKYNNQESQAYVSSANGRMSTRIAAEK